MRPLRPAEHIARQVWGRCWSFRHEAVHCLNEAPKSIARLLRLILASARLGFANSVCVAGSAPDDQTCAAAPVFGCPFPIAVDQCKLCKTMQRLFNIRVIAIE